MKKRRGLKPLHNITLGITLFIFLILLTVMTLQGLLMYLYLRILYRADVPIPQFWRPIPLLLLTSLLAGVALGFHQQFFPRVQDAHRIPARLRQNLKKRYPNPGGAGRISGYHYQRVQPPGPTGHQRAESVQGGEYQHSHEYQRL